jgi:tRNA threonylcarbamoyladenosine biosynthesis protein TsaB
MALILNIDTALETANLGLAEDGAILSSIENDQPKDHAAWIHVAIRSLLEKSGKTIDQLDAVAVSNGPGSYTGLRVGLSTAKGLCYAQDIPLVTIGTLETMAYSAIMKLTDAEILTSGARLAAPDFLICPMIDARRMEVFAAIYDWNMVQIVRPSAIVLDERSFEESLKWQKILFLGNGSEKFYQICKHPNAEFKKLPLDPEALAILSYKNFIGNNFAGLAYTEPLYLKEFYSRQ